MKELFINSVKLMNMSEGEEKAAADIIYATAFVMLMRNGTLYRREYGKDGFARFVINVDGTDYRLQESVVKYLVTDTIELYPYEDNTHPYLDICKLPYTQLTFQDENGDLVDISKWRELAGAAGGILGEGLSGTVNGIKDAMDTPLPDPEITLSENEQAQYILEETEYYKVGAALNLIASLACIVVAMVITMFG